MPVEYVARRKAAHKRSLELAPQPLVLDPEAFQKSYDADSIDDVYRQIGNFAYLVVLRRATGHKKPRKYSNNMFDDPKVMHGFLVAARITSYATDPYKEYCKKEGIDNISSESLAITLKRDKEVHSQLMDMPGPFNSEVEYALGLKVRQRAEENPFCFESSQIGPIYRFKFGKLEEAIGYAYREGYYPGERKGLELSEQYCAAKSFALTRVIPAIIDLAAATPQAFEADLNR